jgi:hypothetical protein
MVSDVLEMLTSSTRASGRRRRRFSRQSFKRSRIVHLDCLLAQVREGSMDVFPRTAIIPHADHGRVICWCPSSLLFPRPQRCLAYF